MTALSKVIVILGFSSISASFFINFQRFDLVDAPIAEFSLPNPDRLNYDWKPVMLRFDQFQPSASGDLGSADMLAEQSAKTEIIDPTDITTALLIGIVADEPKKVILVLASVNSKGQTVKTENSKTISVTLNETILNGWKLVDISSDKILWQHETTERSYLQYLFTHTQNKKIIN